MQNPDSNSQASSLSDSQDNVRTPLDFSGITIKDDSLSAGGTEDSGSSEGIEVEAIEYDKPQYSDAILGIQGIRRLVLFVVAFVVVLTASGVAGFLVLGGKRAAASVVATTSPAKDFEFDLDATTNETQSGSLSPTDPNDYSKLGKLFLNAPNEGQTSAWKDPADTNDEALRASVFSAETSTPTSTPTSSPTSKPSPNPSEAATDGSTQWFTSPSTSSTSSTPRNDSPCDDHNLVVSSSCAEGSSNAISTALFCFASKRDGDWYWVRNSEDGTTAEYDLWDYTEEVEGELNLLNLSAGNYRISLVRDSMRPYDEIISRELTVPECQ